MAGLRHILVCTSAASLHKPTCCQMFAGLLQHCRPPATSGKLNFVTRYEKTHKNLVFLVWIDAEFHEEFNDQKMKLEGPKFFNTGYPLVRLQYFKNIMMFNNSQCFYILIPHVVAADNGFAGNRKTRNRCLWTQIDQGGTFQLSVR